MEDLEKKISELEKRLSELEKKSNLAMFGRSYHQVGDSSSDFLIKTRGLVKIQWGSKFIDLIKDGKINSDSKFIFKEKSVGSKNGIYVVDDNVFLVVDNHLIELVSNNDNTYVSFLTELETTSEQKQNAFYNLGFIYPNLSDVDESAIKNGIVYIQSELKLYIIINGNIQEYSLGFPKSINSQFIISKDTNEKGSLVIKGSGINNSIAFDNMFIYNNNIESSDDIIIDTPNLQLSNKLSSNTIESITPSYTNGGFRLYLNDLHESVLEVDKIIERSVNLEDNIYWITQQDIIQSIEEKSESNYQITFKSNRTYKKDDVFLTEDGIFFKLIDVIKNNDSEDDVTYVTNSKLDIDSNLKVYLVSNYPIKFENNSIKLLEFSNDTLKPILTIGTNEGLVIDPLKAKYTSDLSLEDDSNNFATTKWVKLLINNFNKT